MITVRHIEKLWDSQQFARLTREMLAGRTEASLRLESEFPARPAAAALALIRLDELCQPHVPLYARLLRAVLCAQQPDGGWGDPLTTAVCLRALLQGAGDGPAIERGLAYIAGLQKSEGIWPAVPLRRLPADPFVSAFILLQLGGQARFREAVGFEEAIAWFDANEATLDRESARLWKVASMRCRAFVLTRQSFAQTQPMLTWS